MKKNRLLLSFFEYGRCKIWCVMKLCIIFTVLFSVSASARARAQQERVTLNLSGVMLKTLFQEIQKQTGLYFVYNEELCREFGKVDVAVRNKTVSEVLEEVFQNREFYCHIENKIIVVKSKSQQNQAARYKISGKVTDKEGNALPGVAVLIEGTSIGVATDVDGKYTLELPEMKDVVLVFSFMGMKKQREEVKGRKVIDIVMQEDTQEMEEVVVTGIFERKASSFTGSAVSMTKDQLMRVSNQNLFQSIKNLDPSLMIFENLDAGSDPNKLPDMQLRGTSAFPGELDASSLKGNYTNNPNLPLFILDGFEATVEKIFDLDMNRIESVTILKDAAAKAIYGSKAANGVVVVETKRMTSGKLRVTYTGSVDVTLPDLSSYDLCNAAEKLELEKDYGLFETNSTRVEDIVQALETYNRRLTAVQSGINTDWLAKPLHTGVGHKHNLSFELGDQNLRLLVDVNYNKVTGVMKGSDRTNIGGQISMSYRYNKFNFRDVLSVTVNDSHDSPYGSFGEYARMNPYWSPYDEFGNLVKNAEIIEKNKEYKRELFANPLYNSQLNTLLAAEYVDVTNNLYAEWNALKGIKATLRFGITKKTSNADEYYPANHLKFANYSEDEFFRKGSYQKNEGDHKKLSGDFNINFSKDFAEKHYVFGNIGWSVSGSSYEEVIYKAEGFPSDKMNNIMFARQYAKEGKPTGKEGSVREMGFLAVFNYSYDDRLLFDGSYRTNASSQFGKNNRWGGFWSLGAGWNIHNEKWLKKRDCFSQLKLRGSVGYTGSQGFDSYQSMATYLYNMDRVYDGFLGAYLKGMANDDLMWQKKLDYNLGLDMNIRNRFSLKLDYYISITDNTLVDFTLPTSTGFNSVKENVGKIRNEGVEAKVNWTVFSQPKERTFISVTAAVAHNKNKIVKISEALKHHNEEQEKLSLDKFNSKPIVKYYEGVSMNAIWACRSLGIDPANGREVFLDQKGIPTYSYSPANQVVCGNTLPKVSGNFGLNAEYKGLGFNVVFRYQVGAQMYNQTLVDKVEGCDINYNVDRRVFKGRWRKPGDVTQYRALSRVWVAETQEYKMEKTNPTSRFVQDRNELDISSVNLSYDFYRFHFVRQAGMERLRLSFYMNDVYKFSSIEVERGLNYPFARSFNVSLQATF